MDPISWKWYRFDDFSNKELYEVIRARLEVFSIEQNCIYQDLDRADAQCWHLCGWQDEDLLAYLRLSPPGLKYAEPSIGRVMTTEKGRGSGIGRQLLSKAIVFSEQQFPGLGNRISAQLYLEKFYSEFGFNSVSESYEEDGIPHIEMVLLK